MKRKVLMGALAAGSAVAMMLTGCASPAPAQKVIGLAGLGNDPFWISVMCGGTSAAKAAGQTIEWLTVNEIAVKPMQANLDAAALKKPSGLLIAAIDANAFNDQLAGLMKSGVPVVDIEAIAGKDVTVGSVTSSSDNAEFIKTVVADIGPSGTVGIFGGVPGDIPLLKARWEPLVSQLKSTAPGVKVLDTQYTGFDRAKTTQMAAAMITANPNLTAIYAISGPEGEGVAAAVEEAGKSGKIKVYSYGSSPAEVSALKSGTITALLAQGASLIGSKGYEQLAAAMKNAKAGTPVQPSNKLEEVPLKVLTKQNIDSREAAPWISLEKCTA